MIQRLLRSRRFWLLVTVALLLTILMSVLPLNEWLTGIRGWLVTLGPWAMPAFIAVYVLATVLGLPNIILIVLAGTLFGLVQGIIGVSIADIIGATLCFVVGRTIARQRVKKWMCRHPNFAQLDQALGKKGWKVLLLTRLSPLVPSNVLNYGFSCTKVRFWQYFVTSWLGMLPIITLYVYLGSFGVSFFHGDITGSKLLIQIGGLILTIAAAFYTTHLAKEAISDSEPAQPKPELTRR